MPSSASKFRVLVTPATLPPTSGIWSIGTNGDRAPPASGIRQGPRGPAPLGCGCQAPLVTRSRFSRPLPPRPPADRLANVTRHRRAPAGRPRAGVQADGSSGPRGFASSAPSGPTDSVARPRRPVCPSGLTTRPAAGSRVPPSADARHPLARRRPRKAPRFSKPSAPGDGRRRRPSPPQLRPRRAAPGPAEADLETPQRTPAGGRPRAAGLECPRATWLILPVAYACLKD